MTRNVKLAADTSPPYQFVNAEKEIKGLDYEIIKKSFELVGYDIEVTIQDDWTIINNLLEKGELDGAFQVQETSEKLQKFLFSNLLRNATIEFITSRNDLELTSYKELISKSLTIALLENYSYGNWINDISSKYKRIYKNKEILINDINNGKVDLGVIDADVKTYLVKQKGYKIFSISNLNFTRPLSVAFNKNNKKMRDDFNKGLKKLIETNQYFEITKYWKNKQHYNLI